MMYALSRRILPYLLVIAGLLACLWWAYSHGVSVTTTEWQGKWDKQALELSEAKTKAVILVREEEQRRQSSINKVREDAEKQIALAERDALAASDAAACSPTCSAGLTRERGSWQQLMTAQEPQD